MTIEEKREAINRWCHNWKGCEDCPYSNDNTAWCQHKFLQELNDEEINKLYNECIIGGEAKKLADATAQYFKEVADRANEVKFYRWYIMQNDLMWDCLSKYQEWEEKNG